MNRLCVFLLGLCSMLYAQNVETNWEVLQAEKFEIQYPAGWELNEAGIGGTTFILLSAVENEADIFRENVNLIEQNLAGLEIDMNTYVEVSTKQIMALITEANILESKSMKNENGEFYKIVYTGKQGNLSLKFEQYFWIVNETAYVLTFTTEQDKYESYQALGKKILDSFRIK